MRRALAAHRTDFVAIVALVVDRASRSPPTCSITSRRSRSARATTACGGVRQRARRSRPGRARRSRSRACRSARSAGSGCVDGRAVVTMNIYKQYAPIYRNATVLLRPRTPLKDMYLALDPGTRQAGAVPDGGLLGSGEHEPDRRPRPDPRLARRRHAQLPAVAARGRRAGLPGPGRGESVPARRSRAARSSGLRAVSDRDTRTFATLLVQARATTSGSRSTTSQRVATALGGVDGQLASLIASSNTNFAAISSQDANLEAGLTLLPGHAHADQPDARQGPAVRRPARPGAPSAAAVRPRARAGAPGVAAAVPRHDAGHRESAAAVLGRGAAARPGAAPGGHAAVEGGAAAVAVGRRGQHAVQHAGLPAVGRRAGLPVLGLVAGPHRGHADRSSRTRRARACAGSSWRPARRSTCSRRRSRRAARRSRRCSTC